MSDDEIYFQCPNCHTTYDYTAFHKLEHTSRADASYGIEVLGQAKCANCAFEFYYYLTSDVYPVIVQNDPSPEFILDVPEQADDIDAPSLPLAPDTEQVEPQKDGQDRMAQFEQAINDIDQALSPPEMYKRISEALDIIVSESPPQIEAGFALLKKNFKLTARDIEAFRKEVNKKREQIETQQTVAVINAVFSKITQPPKELSDDEQQAAIKYLEDPALFDNISSDIAEAGGIVGEETNKMMLYLAATSRKFKKPISLVIFGKSSSGKSYLANAVEQFMPEEDTLVLSSLSAKALEYAGDQLMNKCILVQEWEGLKEAQATLRVLQSEGKLSRYVTIVDPMTKTRKAVPHDLECPCSVIVTTTKEGIHDENSTRIFELYADESIAQTAHVVRQNIMKADMAKRISEEDKRQILDLHHDVQRVLEPLEVNIPFAEYLTFPAKTTRHRRDSDRFINLIKAVAFLRQKQKENKGANGDKYIDADLDDYKIAYKIGLDVIRATLNPISDRSKNVFIVCCELNERLINERKDPWFSISDIQGTAQELNLDFRNRKDLYKQMDTLEEYEYVERKQARKNSTRYYKVCFPYERNEAREIINIDVPDFKDILTPEQLDERLRGLDPELVYIPPNPDDEPLEI